MSHQEMQNRLNDYVDGLLSDQERQEMERHLKGCETCRRDAESLRALLADAAALPLEIAPSRDIWPEVATRIAQRKVLTADLSRPARWPVRRLAAAAVLLIALSSAIAALLLQERHVASVATAPQRTAQPAATALTAFQASEGDYIRAIAQLTDAVNRRRDRLDPKTVAIIEKNLHIIDEAIQESRAALAADPNSIERVFAVARMYEAKIGLLHQVSDLSSGI